jgi:2-keto-4-pentenoate hydratase
MDAAAISQAIDILADCFLKGKAIDALPEASRPTSLSDAYRIQDGLVAKLGKPLGGWKVGATNPAPQKALGLPGPFAGRIFADRILADGVTLSAKQARMRGMEAEFAFRFKTPLKGRNAVYSREEVLEAVDAVIPAVEVLDGRFLPGMKIGGRHIIADLGYHGYFVLGEPIPNWRKVDLIACEASMTIDGKMVQSGTGAAVLGDPVAALVWLTNHARRHRGIAAGMIVPTGSMTGLHFAPNPSEAVADYGKFGKIRVAFAP